MSLDRSLKSHSALAKHRNVLKRDERVARLTEQDRFDPASGNPVGLPKVANRKLTTGKKTKKKDEAAEAAAAPAAAGKAAAGGKAAPAAKAAPGGKK